VIRRRRFPPDPASVAEARRFAVAAARGCHPIVVESLELMISELATNAIRHAGAPFEIRLDRRNAEIRAEVRDAGDGEPRLRTPRLEDPHGRGLRIVDMLAARWGIDHGAGGGKTVWFTLATDTAEDRRGRRPQRPAAPVRSDSVTSRATGNSERSFSAAARSSTRMRSASSTVPGSPARSATRRSSS
jgi:anti-sigma regulatory factor (Ser/Thr protein kinase)